MKKAAAGLLRLPHDTPQVETAESCSLSPAGLLDRQPLLLWPPLQQVREQQLMLQQQMQRQQMLQQMLQQMQQLQMQQQTLRHSRYQ